MPTRIDGVNTTAVVITTASAFENRTTGVYRNPFQIRVFRPIPRRFPGQGLWMLSVVGRPA